LSLAQRGASSLRVEAVLPSKSAPNWASILRGVGPEVHGVTSNRWWWWPCAEVHGPPSIVARTRHAYPGASVGVFYEWADFTRLVEPDPGVTSVWDPDAARLVERAAAFARDGRPKLLFVHLLLIDAAGHEHGWGSRAYRDAVRVADGLVQRLVDAMLATGARVAVVVCSDHGGIGTSHGGSSPGEVDTPVIVVGPDVEPAGVLLDPAHTYDITATIGALLGLPRAAGGQGRSLLPEPRPVAAQSGAR
jgi:predicted AlkP superfamily pyrophosphatase or phosphodiesterase